MGVLHYHDHTFEFEDRILAHIQIVAGLKLRRSECFYLSWLPSRDSGAGRQVIWITPGVPLYFAFSGSRVPAANRSWVDRLVAGANSGAGLNLSDERNREPVAGE